MSTISLRALSDEKLKELELKEKNGTLSSDEKNRLFEHRFLPKAVDAMAENYRLIEERKEFLRQSKFKVIDKYESIPRLDWTVSFNEAIALLKSDVKKYSNFYWIVETIDNEAIVWEGHGFILQPGSCFYGYGPSYAIQLFQALVKNKNAKRVAQMYNGIVMYLYEGKRN